MLMIVLAVAVVVLSNFLSFGVAGFFGLALAFFMFLAGLGVLMMGVTQSMGQAREKKGSNAQTQVIREIVKVRRSHCGALNFETISRSTNCGANF
ncbi:hypothetical protein AUG19_02155 [archaeon 13_1_20CM_2_54_9]|nr:MAG: hypothetical protein AUJ07_11570 [Crenarchaeota archaeon 13_1_40CM_3_53_5]OLE76719.1 MAG: hypothetical protein AUG19_02155 [archaeon 13_1_20CM_2_54_9]TMI26657.1 MAG: hypothetical protein E6H36_04995 [Candidatus Bathyarchaeota archaeon]